jgi:nitrogen regulatory protein P-II 1
MKKLEIIIKPEKLESLKNILDDCEASGLMITNIMGYGNQKGIHVCTEVQRIMSTFCQR